MRNTQTERSEKEKRKQTEIITQRNSNSIETTAALFHMRQNLGFQNELRMASYMCMWHGEKCFSDLL